MTKEDKKFLEELENVCKKHYWKKIEKIKQKKSWVSAVEFTDIQHAEEFKYSVDTINKLLERYELKVKTTFINKEQYGVSSIVYSMEIERI